MFQLREPAARFAGCQLDYGWKNLYQPASCRMARRQCRSRNPRVTTIDLMLIPPSRLHFINLNYRSAGAGG
jgi:hypothetical protein